MTALRKAQGPATPGPNPPSPELARDLLEHATEVMYRFGPDGRLDVVVGPVERLFGVDPNQVLGRNVLDLVHPGHRAEAERHLRDKMEGRSERAAYELLMQRPDGSSVWVELSSSAIRRGGSLVAVQGTMRDISRRKAMEHELEAERRRHQDLFENANDIIYTHDLTGRFTAVNSMAIRTYGYSKDEFLRMTIADLVHPDHLATARSNLAAKVKGLGDRTPPYELLSVAKDGSHVWVEVSTRLMREEGKPAAIQGIVRDISARKMAEARVHESEARYRSLVDGVPVGLFRTAPDGRFLDANPALVRIMGAPDRDALLARSARDFYVDPAGRAQVLEETAASDGGRQFEAEARRWDGTALFVRGTMRAVRGPDGDIVAYEGHVEDVTQERQAAARTQLVHSLALDLNKAPDFTSALGLALRSVCQASGWAYAECWTPTPDGGHLAAGEAWYGNVPALGKFHKQARQLQFAPGEGLPGRCWVDGQTVWRADLAREPGFHRAASALALGLRTVLMVPVRTGDETVAVLGFLHTTHRPEDLAWVQVVEAVATNLGVVMGRRQAEDRLRAQTALLEGQLESSPDGILAVAPDGSILAANRKLLDLCGVQLVEDRADAGRWVGQALMDRVSDPKRFLARVRFLYENPGTGDEIVLEGRTYRRTQARLRDADRLDAGRVLFFRDVSEEKQLKARIEATENSRKGR